MENKTLKEIHIEFGISRRAIQGYEKEGLVHATSKMERGYLLYDEEMVERIKLIKLYQELGFKVKQIKEIIDAPSDVKKAALKEIIGKLKGEKTKMDHLIKQAEKMLEEL